jgi:DNA-binding transcriptional LysR family regulator
MISGPVNISAPRDFGLIYLSPAILSFSKRYPEIQMTVDFDDRTVDLNREN